MKILNRLKSIFASGIFVLVSFTLVACTTKTDVNVVTISGRQVLLNNKPYVIKGVCYHPISKGSDKRSFENLTQDLALMREAGVNTIRVYSPIDDRTVLDEIAAAGIRVIVGFGYNQEGYFDIFSGSFIKYVNTYKNHPAILFWELGNEYNYHPEWFGGDIKNWYKAMNVAADLIHQNDKNHPVATAHGELPDSLALALSGNIDIWGINIYRWDKPESFFPQWTAISDKPMYFSEAGADSYMTVATEDYVQGVNEKAQADATRKILEATFNQLEVCAGVTLYAFVDEWWKAGSNAVQDPGGWAPNSTGVPYDGSPNEEYWGIVDINRKKKEAFDVVKSSYTSVPK